LAWHAHEMLWGFVATIAVGFLLTAGANWTGRNPLRGNALAALCLVWLAARAGYLVPGRPAFLLAGIAGLVFFLWGAAALGRSGWLTRNKRHYGVPLLLAAPASAHVLDPTAPGPRHSPGPMRHFHSRPPRQARP
ncbi:NnrS family protein, partial [Achromobacter sp. Marseille-Q0513]|uniref:NnrS family protein n=1 Tax=Achromobacter sp. Marseille-Q0513 TaxID=2829161 RepID=UPI001B978715